MMIERRQPVVEGVDGKGELVWGVIAMPRWQMEMFRIRYVGDFSEHWMYASLLEKLGMEWAPSQPYYSGLYAKNKRSVSGD